MRTSRIQTAAVLVLAIVLLAYTAEARTWRVEKDGSGDFTVIQHAVDAAANGDTIRIGPGRFEEFIEHTNQGALWRICVYLDGHSRLTVLGAGPQETIIDFAPAYDPGLYSVGISAYPSENLVIRDIGLGSFLYAISVEGGDLEISNCAFRGESPTGTEGIWPRASGVVRITDCYFYNLATGITSLDDCAELVIERCRFEGGRFGVEVQYESNLNTRVIDCDFYDCMITAIGLDFGAGGEIRGNTVRGNSRMGISLEGSGAVQVLDNDVEITSQLSPEANPWGVALFLWPRVAYDVVCAGNIFRSNQVCVYAPYPRERVSFHGNHILPIGDGYAVRCYFDWDVPLDLPAVLHWDFTQNYWGTTDAAQVAELILDYADEPQYEVAVDYLPMADGPIATESSIWSKVKTLWR
jgi:parallel beta-helix repeat protein